jgi:trehalose/maltose hydrolase-like predicted phosphorylase
MPHVARRFEAIVFDWDGTSVLDRRADAIRIRSLVEEACALGLELALVSDADVGDLDSRLGARPDGPGGLMLAVNRGSAVFRVDLDGPRPVWRRANTEAVEIARATATESVLADARVASDAKPDPRVTSDANPDPRVTSDATLDENGQAHASDSVRWIVSELWRRGIASDQILIAGDELGPVASLLEDQIARRGHGELPIVNDNAQWTLTIDDVDPMLERVNESLLTLADGRLGTRGSLLGDPDGGDPAVFMSGVYTRGGAETHLLPGPRWNTIAVDDDPIGPVRRVLDLHAGLMHQQRRSADGRLDALLFSSLAHPGTTVLRVTDRSRSLSPGRTLEPPSRASYEEGETDGCAWMRVTGRPGSIAAAAHDHVHGTAEARVLDRIGGYEGVPQGIADEGSALDRVRRARELGFDRMLCEHRQAWASRWEDADVRIEGDPELQQAVRLALFHVLSSVPEEGEAAVGARGLTGNTYRGHVFWDSDVYVLPCLAATHPRAARAMLEYRVRRLAVAMRVAHAQGRGGARFPWESAHSGKDVTPKHMRDRHGEIVPVLTGQLEEHIVADVAWAAACYIDWTGDEAFAAGAGCELIVQAARWWASRIERDDQGRGHIRDVIGPDEYHEHIDDNAFTNVMARWNLRRAADVGAGVVPESERRRWLEIADTIVDGYDPATGIYEQFAGFNALEPFLIEPLAPHRSVSPDDVVGRGRVHTSQAVKQADVLMLHYLVPDEVAAGSLEPNLSFYGVRTAHESTLSPGVHAALLARAGQPEHALEMLRRTARIDLDDIGNKTGGGVRLAAMGTVWRALAFGFAGLRPAGDALVIDPILPPGWESLELRVRFRGSRVHIRFRPGLLEASADPPVGALISAGERVELTPAFQKFACSPPFPGGPDDHRDRRKGDRRSGEDRRTSGRSTGRRQNPSVSDRRLAR